jgi:hypothetical protein
MAYTDFKTFTDIEEKCGVNNRYMSLFADNLVSIPSENLIRALGIAKSLPTRSEKAKSELIVIPILLELREQNGHFFTIHSGDTLNADEEKGLKGECDFIIAKDIGSFDINYPILQVVEAKRHDLDIGIPQCAAQMIGARFFNQRKKREMPIIYGCVTTGDDWIFLKLEGDTIFVDTKKYYLSEIENILGVFQYVIDYYKQII